MKRLLLLFVFVSMLFIGCVSTPEVKYIGDEYYPDKGYFEITGGRITFRTINGTDKIIVIYNTNSKNLMTVNKTDRVLFKFADGKELVLKYTSRVSQYDRILDRFVLKAQSGVIANFGTLEMIRVETEDGYRNAEISEGNSQKIIIRFNEIQEAATAKYGSN